MAVVKLVPEQKRPSGERCCEPVVHPDVGRDEAMRMAEVAKGVGGGFGGTFDSESPSSLPSLSVSVDTMLGRIVTANRTPRCRRA